MTLQKIINSTQHPVQEKTFRSQCKQILDRNGVLVMPDFLNASAIRQIQQEGVDNQNLAFYTTSTHNIYLKPSDSTLPPEHPRNREISSSKGCITTDQIPQTSPLHTLYNSDLFKEFLCQVLGESELYEYADPLSAINLHYASEGQELGWHFDNSSFAITLLIQAPHDGGVFEYVKNVRDADAGDMNYELSDRILNGEVASESVTMQPGTLVLFRGRNSMHRVTPTVGDRTRMLVVLAYNTEPDIALSESARMTFYGRLN